MAKIIGQEIGDNFALYNGDCMAALPALPDGSAHLSIYSPPFCGLYNYSSDPRDMSNCRSPEEFFAHYLFLVEEIHRIMMPGRLTCVHAMDIPKGGDRGLMDLPGDIIRLHCRCRDGNCKASEYDRASGNCGHGWFKYHARFNIWKEPLRVAIRTRSKGLTHRQLVKDSSFSNNAGADCLLVFRRSGTNPVPITHGAGLMEYAGEREIPAGLVEKFKGWQNPQTNKLAHWIWQQYASSFWDDIRLSRVLPYREARESQEEKHVHPLQLDVIERCVQLWSNPGEVVLTPFMGVGSEVYGAVVNGRRGVGIELKESYFRQAVQNVKLALLPKTEQPRLLDDEALAGDMGTAGEGEPE